MFFNFNCVVLDPAKVSIGDNALFGPNVQIYTATHPISYLERRRGLESAKEITIGSDVWIGGGVVIGPGLNIGSRSVIGAGSVLTKDIPEGVFAAGNPCRVLREIEVALALGAEVVQLHARHLEEQLPPLGETRIAAGRQRHGLALWQWLLSFFSPFPLSFSAPSISSDCVSMSLGNLFSPFSFVLSHDSQPDDDDDVVVVGDVRGEV